MVMETSEVPTGGRVQYRLSWAALLPILTTMAGKTLHFQWLPARLHQPRFHVLLCYRTHQGGMGETSEALMTIIYYMGVDQDPQLYLPQ